MVSPSVRPFDETKGYVESQVLTTDTNHGHPPCANLDILGSMTKILVRDNLGLPL